MTKIPKGCEGCRNQDYFEGLAGCNKCFNYEPKMKKVKVYLVQPYHHKKEDGKKLKRYPCIQGYGLQKGGMYIREQDDDI